MADQKSGHYVSRNKPAHSALSQDRLNELFIRAGWIGKYREPVKFIKAPPHIEGRDGR